MSSRRSVAPAARRGLASRLQRDAEEALLAYDHLKALRLFGKALESCPTSDAERFRHLILSTARAGRLANAPEAALDLLEAVRKRLGDGRHSGHVLLAIARLRSYQDDYSARAEALLEATRQLRRWGDIPGRASALAELAFPAGRAISIQDRIGYGELARELAATTEDLYIRSYSTANLADALFSSGDTTAVELLREARLLLDLDVHSERLEYLRQSANLAIYLVWFGEFANARAALAEMRLVADEPFWLEVLRHVERFILWRSGDWDAALEIGPPPTDASPVVLRLGRAIESSISYERGSDVDAQELEDIASVFLSSNEDAHSSLALALCVRNRAWRREPNAARGVLEHLEDVFGIGLWAARQDLLPLLAALDPAGYAAIREHTSTHPPAGRHAVACHLLAEGIHVSEPHSIELLEQAAAELEAMGDLYHLAVALERMSRITTGAKARSAAQRAADAYEALGAERSLARHLRASRGRGLLSHRRIPSNQRYRVPGLTSREGEVAELAAAGFTNAEIAERLSISLGTVRKHLEHIRAKLNIRRKNDLVRLFRVSP